MFRLRVVACWLRVAVVCGGTPRPVAAAFLLYHLLRALRFFLQCCDAQGLVTHPQSPAGHFAWRWIALPALVSCGRRVIKHAYRRWGFPVERTVGILDVAW